MVHKCKEGIYTVLFHITSYLCLFLPYYAFQYLHLICMARHMLFCYILYRALSFAKVHMYYWQRSALARTSHIFYSVSSFKYQLNSIIDLRHNSLIFPRKTISKLIYILDIIYSFKALRICVTLLVSLSYGSYQ